MLWVFVRGRSWGGVLWHIRYGVPHREHARWWELLSRLVSIKFRGSRQQPTSKIRTELAPCCPLVSLQHFAEFFIFLYQFSTPPSDPCTWFWLRQQILGGHRTSQESWVEDHDWRCHRPLQGQRRPQTMVSHGSCEHSTGFSTWRAHLDNRVWGYHRIETWCREVQVVGKPFRSWLMRRFCCIHPSAWLLAIYSDQIGFLTWAPAHIGSCAIPHNLPFLRKNPRHTNGYGGAFYHSWLSMLRVVCR